MGTQGTGRKRSTKKDRTTAEDDALNLIAREAEARLAAKRAARAEAREIRMKELERQQKELSDDDERMSVGSRGSVRVEDRDYLEKGSRAASALTAATLTSLGGTSSRRGSGETALTVDAESSIREIKDALAEVEEKYRKAMVSNAQLDNEKNNLMYQVDTLKDSLMELEELLSESRRECEEKVKECEREKHAHSVLQFQFNEMKETLKQSEELLNEIRQLRLKQEGFVREISDLQETVEWKDKKIGALERQKEFTDAIRTERDELREEVVKLKDILKKHGIVLGPDLNINGDVGVAEADECPSADPASQPAQDSQTPPAEGNSMLGNTEETELRSNREEEEVDPEQQQEMLEEARENYMSSDLLCNAADVSTLETSNEEQPPEEQERCLPTEERNTGENGLSKDLNAEIVDSPSTEAKEVIVCSPELQEIITSPDVPGTEMSEEVNLKEESIPDVDETDTKSSSVETSDVQDGKQEAVEESSLTNIELCPQQKHAEVVPKESLTDESIPAASNTEPQQVPENAEEAENDEAEEIPDKSQSQGTPASGKKKKKRRRGKKKGGAQDDKTKQKNETANEPAENVVGSAAEPTSDGSVTETFKESKMDQIKNTQNKQEAEEVDAVEPIKSSEAPLKEALEEPTVDHGSNKHEEEQTLETNTVKEAEVVESTLTICEAPKEVTVDHVMDEQNQEQTLETRTTDIVETGEPTPSVSHVETLEGSSTDSKMDDQGTEQTLETIKIEETEVVSPAENACQEETLNKVTVDDVTEEQNKEQTLETETEQSETEEPTESSSHLETLKESGTDSKEDDHDEKQTLEVETLHEVEAVAPIENTEIPSEITVDHVTDEQNEGETLETETVESVETVKSVSPVETLKESRTDSEKDKNDHEQNFEMEKVKEMETSPRPDTEVNICTAELHSNSAESTDGLTSRVDDSESVAISTDGDVICTDQAEDDVESVDSKSESTSNNAENTPETSSNTEGESHIPSNSDVAANESEPASESKDDTPILSLPTDDSLDGIKSLSDMEPSEAINLGRDDPPINVSNEDPEESADGEPRAETEQECLPASVISPSQGSDNSVNGNLKEPKELVSPDEKCDSCDGASSTESPEAFSTEKSLGEAVVQDEQLEISTAAVLETPQTPKEATEIGSLIDQESAVTEDLEHKNDKHDEESEPCLSVEQLHESSKDQCENKDSSQPTEVDSEGEEGDEDEGQSFDFDDMDIEVAVEPSLLLEQEQVEEAVKIMPDESNNGPCQSNAESNENKPVEGNDSGNQADKDSDTVPEEEQNSAAHEETTSAKDKGDQAGQVAEEGIVSSAGALGAVAENINQTVSSLAEEGIDIDKNVWQGEDADVAKSADQVGSNKGAAQSGKESKKSGKKGKGKGKEECKMS